MKRSFSVIENLHFQHRETQFLSNKTPCNFVLRDKSHKETCRCSFGVSFLALTSSCKWQSDYIEFVNQTPDWFIETWSLFFFLATWEDWLQISTVNGWTDPIMRTSKNSILANQNKTLIRAWRKRALDNQCSIATINRTLFEAVCSWDAKRRCHKKSNAAPKTRRVWSWW